MKISGKRINHVASPGWLFLDYYVGKKHSGSKINKNDRRSFSKSARRYVKNETNKLIMEVA